MNSPFQKIVIGPLREVARKLVAFLPNLLTGIVVFLAGLLLAWVLKIVVVRVLRLFKLGAAFARSGFSEALEKVAVKETPSKLIGRTVFWLLAFVFFILALKVMKVPAIDQLLERLLLFLPNVFIALIILAIGWLLANFLGRASLIAAVNSGVKLARQLSKTVKAVILIFAFVMAFEQLGIGRTTMIAAFAIAFGGVVLSLALAFGLGGRGLARRYLEKRFRKDEESRPDDISHI